MLKRFDGSNYIDVKNVKRFDGVNYIDIDVARKYHEGNWVDVYTAQPDVINLYDNGNECINITGGWIKEKYGNATIDLSGNKVYLWCKGATGVKGTAVMCTTKMIDCTQYNKLCVEVSDSSGSPNAGYLFAVSDTNVWNQYTTYAAPNPTNPTRRIESIDISAVNKLQYVKFLVDCSASTIYSGYATFYKVYLSKF